MQSTMRCLFTVVAVGYCLGSDAVAAPITGTIFENINNNTTQNPFFSNNGSTPYQGSILSGGGSSSTVTGTGISTTGSATPGSGFTDGNGIPDGVIVSFDVQFVITANAGTLTENNASGGNGLAINSGTGNANQLDVGEQLFFSSIAFSNAMVTADPNGYLLDNSVTVNNTLWRVLRSNNLAEATEGAKTSSDSAGTLNVNGFGTAGSGAIDNDFTSGLFGPLASVYISTTAGQWQVKGIGYQYDVTVNAVPEPAALMLGCLGFLACTSWRKKGIQLASG